MRYVERYFFKTGRRKPLRSNLCRGTEKYGPAGATVVIVKDEILGKSGRRIPTMLDYATHIEKESMYNTPPVFAVYASMLTMEWLENHGGVAWIEGINNEKASTLYAEIDRNALFYGTAETEDRSRMNACFLLKDEALTETFDSMLKAAGIVGLNGHRSVGVSSQFIQCLAFKQCESFGRGNARIRTH